jgi:putative transposase
MLELQYELPGGEAGVQVPLLPTPEQAGLLNRTFGSVRYVYNRALAERSRAWTQEQRRVTFADTCRMLTGWKADPETAWLYEVSNVALQQGLQHLQHAYASFGEAGEVPAVQVPAPLEGVSNVHDLGVPVQGWPGHPGEDERAAGHPLVPRPARGRGAIKRDREPRQRGPVAYLDPDRVPGLGAPAGGCSGRDRRGDHDPDDASTGEKIASPRHDRRDRHRLVKAQRNLSRKKKGSANRARAKVRVARVHARIADRRRDHLHKLSTRIIRESQAVIIEDLSVANMVRNHTLARAISDASWSEFRRMLEYKAAWYGRTVVAIDRFYPSSKTCSACGAIAAKMPLNVRDWTCTACGAAHDRDVNAAVNIRTAGLAVLACGDGVRPPCA